MFCRALRFRRCGLTAAKALKIMISRASQFFLSVFAPRFLMRGTLSSTSSGALYVQRKQNGAPQAKKSFWLLAMYVGTAA